MTNLTRREALPGRNSLSFLPYYTRHPHNFLQQCWILVQLPGTYQREAVPRLLIVVLQVGTAH